MFTPRALLLILPALIMLLSDAGFSHVADRPDAVEGSGEDFYETYMKHSKDFQSVFQNREVMLEAWPGWIYMPWTWQWIPGYSEAAGRWSVAHGYNGAFLDHAATKVNGEDKLAWIEEHGLRFYVDHLAGKGDLHLWDMDEVGPHRTRIRSTGVRPVALDAALKEKLETRICERIEKVKDSPFRAAYSLDDEASWGSFVAPCMWRCEEDPEAYARWVKNCYGPEGTPCTLGTPGTPGKPGKPGKPGRSLKPQWISYDAMLPKLKRWAIQDFDCSALMDAWTYNDAVWCDLIHDLVMCAHAEDPKTPCGIVGAQSPSPFGGYDYARLMRKVSFIEAYDLGSSHSIIRSFNPGNAMPVVTTHFHRFDAGQPGRAEESIWRIWYYLAHGNSGMIGWVDEGWFDADTGEPRTWHDALAPHCLEAGRKIGPLVRGAEWMHDGVAIYYSHASIQLGWILDAEAHGNTWWNRKHDHRLGASHCVRRAWEDMLRDEGLQYDFISYVDLIQRGVDEGYRVLILPAALCLSDVEAQRIRAFCEAGGTVIADYMPGLWDQRGRGRKTGGALDGLFGAKHDPGLRASHVFQERLWTEVDQEARYDYETNEAFLCTDNRCVMHESGFHKAVRDMETEFTNTCGKGRAVLMNLSPQMYNVYRERGAGQAKKRVTFMRHLHRAGLNRWVEVMRWNEEDGKRLAGADGEEVGKRLAGAGCEEKVENGSDETFGYTITYWKQNDRVVLFVVFHSEITGEAAGQGGVHGFKTANTRIRLKFASKISEVRNERTREALPASDSFKLQWKMNEAVVISFAASDREP